MRTSARGIALIKEFEGIRLDAYKDSAGVWTIGYGHTSSAGHPKVTQGLRITQKEAEEILQRDLIIFELALKNAVKVPLNQNQFDALVSWTFNVGAGAMQRSTLIRKLNEGLYNEVPSELARWNKAGRKILKGLQRRRAAEANLWSSSVDGSESPDSEVVVVEEKVMVETDPTKDQPTEKGVPWGIWKKVNMPTGANGALALGAVIVAVIVIAFIALG